MSLLPAFVQARMRNSDSAPQPETPADSPRADSPESADDNIFELLPPKSAETAAPEPEPQGGNVDPVNIANLSRLSIDSDGRLYWDGKPVVTHQRFSMSRAQVVGASIVAGFVVIGAIASVIQGTVAARELACRLGWSASSCTLPGGQPRNRSDIPA